MQFLCTLIVLGSTQARFHMVRNTLVERHAHETLCPRVLLPVFSPKKAEPCRKAKQSCCMMDKFVAGSTAADS